MRSIDLMLPFCNNPTALSFKCSMLNYTTQSFYGFLSSHISYVQHHSEIASGGLQSNIFGCCGKCLSLKGWTLQRAFSHMALPGWHTRFLLSVSMKTLFFVISSSKNEKKVSVDSLRMFRQRVGILRGGGGVADGCVCQTVGISFH